ncbi:MAG: hypothetical protein B7Z80_14805 [Rhodospirillales bacterium 20-64-7]|nr:MAG: hypothetical protein B7Z80_14805 [Rhodospirillales bacterium 20-64-7]
MDGDVGLQAGSHKAFLDHNHQAAYYACMGGFCSGNKQAIRRQRTAPWLMISRGPTFRLMAVRLGGTGRTTGGPGAFRCVGM